MAVAREAVAWLVVGRVVLPVVLVELRGTAATVEAVGEEAATAADARAVEMARVAWVAALEVTAVATVAVVLEVVLEVGLSAEAATAGQEVEVLAKVEVVVAAREAVRKVAA